MNNKKDYCIKFGVWVKENASQKMRDIIINAKEQVDSKPNYVFDTLREALVMSGLFELDTLISVKVLSDEEFKYLDDSLSRVNLPSATVDYNSKEFEHQPVELIGVYLDTMTSDEYINSDEFKELDRELSLGLQNDIDNDPSVSNILSVFVKEKDLVSMYDKYFNEHGIPEMFYELVVKVIRTFIPVAAMYITIGSLENDAPNYNKYTLTLLTAYIARTIGVKFSLEVCNDDESLALQVACYELAFFKNIDFLARTAVKSDDHWMESCAFEAHAGALAGCGFTIGRVPGIKYHIGTKDEKFEQIDCRLDIYYKSVNELMFMLTKIVSTYVLNINAKNINDIYIGEEIPTEEIDKLTLKLKEVKANHNRVLKYSDALSSIDRGTAEPKMMARIFEKEKLSGIFQTAISKLESFDMPFHKSDFASIDEYESAVRKEIMGAYNDIKYAVKRGKFRDKCRIRELTDPDNLKEVEGVINTMSKKFDKLRESIDDYDTGEWKAACKLLLDVLEHGL